MHTKRIIFASSLQFKMRAKIFLFLIISTILSSCFEIIEEVTLNADGSGSFEYTLNMSQSRKELNSIRQVDSFKNARIPSEAELNADIEKGLNVLKSCPGIHNVVITKDYEEYIFNLQFDFDTISDLTFAIRKVYSSMAGRKMPFQAYFNLDNGIMNRSSNFHTSGAFEKLNFQNRKILSTSDYTAIYRFKDMEVESVENRKAKISGNKKAVFLKANILDMVDGKSTISNSIRTKTN